MSFGGACWSVFGWGSDVSGVGPFLFPSDDEVFVVCSVEYPLRNWAFGSATCHCRIEGRATGEVLGIPLLLAEVNCRVPWIITRRNIFPSPSGCGFGWILWVFPSNYWFYRRWMMVGCGTDWWRDDAGGSKKTDFFFWRKFVLLVVLALIDLRLGGWLVGDVHSLPLCPPGLSGATEW